MNTITNTVIDAAVMDAPDGLTVSMVEVDAAAARAALSPQLALVGVDLEHPAVVAAGWRPPTPAGDTQMVTIPADDRDAPALFGDDSGGNAGGDCVGIGGGRSGPPGWPR